MTTHTTSHSISSEPARRLDPGRALPLVLEANAVTSIAAGLVASTGSSLTACGASPSQWAMCTQTGQSPS